MVGRRVRSTVPVDHPLRPMSPKCRNSAPDSYIWLDMPRPPRTMRGEGKRHFPGEHRWPGRSVASSQVLRVRERRIAIALGVGRGSAEIDLRTSWTEYQGISKACTPEARCCLSRLPCVVVKETPRRFTSATGLPTSKLAYPLAEATRGGIPSVAALQPAILEELVCSFFPDMAARFGRASGDWGAAVVLHR